MVNERRNLNTQRSMISHWILVGRWGAEDFIKDRKKRINKTKNKEKFFSGA